MASSPATSASSGNNFHAQEQPDFAMQWQPTDASSLEPANLHLTRNPRAWERKPLSPFSRQKMRVGKIYKRAAPVEIRKRRGLGGAAGRKPVKKLRLDDGGAVAVARWEGEDGGVGSPVRKIVLRDCVGEGELVELPEEQVEEVGGDEEEDGATVEVFDDSGTLLDVDPEDVEAQQEWEDEEVEEDEFNPTMMHLGELVEQARQQSNVGTSQGIAEVYGDASAEEGASVEQENIRPAPSEEGQTAQLTPTARQEVVLPEGFVSPVKQAPAPPSPRARKSVSSRRRTLPTEWRPSRLRQSTLAYESDDGEAATVTDVPVLAEAEEAATEDEPTAPVEISSEAIDEGAEQEWEDVEEEVEDNAETELSADMDDAPVTEEDTAREVLEDESALALASVEAASPTKLPSSPVPTVEGQHPRLPLRRSPRRKSSSPVKQNTIRPSTEQPHFLAFTPIKGLRPFPALAASPDVNEESIEDATEHTTPIPLDRSVSAPPEEPKMSPHRPSRPRVSDDTALLQAFLNRAAETKSSGRRLSATKQESITNRRDSDVVRQALASPVKPDVLAEMDPNSPSPRKTLAVSDEVDNANILPEPEQSPLQKTRRSGRATRKAAPQTATPAAAPNKIAIRGNSDGVVLKKSREKGVSDMTRANTRKNKGTSVLPLYRLAQLQEQGVADPLDNGMAVDDELISKPNSRGKALRWNETLVEVWKGGDVSETSMLSDGLSSSGPLPVEEDNVEVEADVPTSPAAPPPPAETPSKPKIRRLKATRTAATPGKAPAAPVEDAAKAEGAAPPAKTALPTKRRSRIATPAKGLSNASLLPAELEPTPAPAPAQPAQQQPKKSIPTPTSRSKKAPASKLPAPASSTTAPPTTSALGQGKENALISSPPKKKPTGSNAMPSAKTFAPKLDFAKSLPPSNNGGSQEDAPLPGLASPAKKAGRRGGVMFAPPSMSASESQEGNEEVPLGLRSPAKKRMTRKAAVGDGR